MGSPVSPIVANLYMEWFEQRALSTFHTPPKFWGRYVDDTLTVIKKSHRLEFMDHINSTSEPIKFTSESEVDGTIPMLETLAVMRPDRSLKFKVYRKQTHTDQYLAFDSHHPLQHKLGVVHTLHHRVDTIVSEDDDKEEE